MHLFLPFILLFQLLADPSVSSDEIFFTESGYAEFTSRVPLHTFTGKSDHLTGMVDPSENVIDFYLDLNTLRTGIDRRDRDMFRTLNVEEHSFAEFTGTFDSDYDFYSENEQSVVATGEFTVHGVTHDVEIEGKIQNTENGLTLKASWDLLLEDYGIEPPGILFYRVDDEINVSIEADLQKRSREEI